MEPSPAEEVALAASDATLAVLVIGLAGVEGLTGVDGLEGSPLVVPLGASPLEGLEGLGGAGEEGFAAGGADGDCFEGGLRAARDERMVSDRARFR